MCWVVVSNPCEKMRKMLSLSGANQMGKWQRLWERREKKKEIVAFSRKKEGR